ncbi:MAG: class I fructose-bisphosphate aldolase [Patescibacteria group bacterium]
MAKKLLYIKYPAAERTNRASTAAVISIPGLVFFGASGVIPGTGGVGGVTGVWAGVVGGIAGVVVTGGICVSTGTVGFSSCTNLLYHDLMDELQALAKKLVTEGKGILAADESFPSIEKRFETIGIVSTHETRLSYRKMLFSTPNIENYISGIIQFDETLRDRILDNPKVISGIKVDQGTENLGGFPGEKITKGIEGLSGRLKEYKSLNAKFTKWRATFGISASTPTIECIEQNANLLSEFAAISQAEGFVPIVEPEVLMDGDHSIDKCYETTRAVLKIIFEKLKQKNVNFSAMLLKSNMILPGKDSLNKITPADIAQKTIEVLREVVPAGVPGIVFLSGGQTEDEATDNLREINKVGDVDFELSFSFGRALQNSALKAWTGKDENGKIAQGAFLKRAKMNSEARYGK